MEMLINQANFRTGPALEQEGVYVLLWDQSNPTGPDGRGHRHRRCAVSDYIFIEYTRFMP